MQVIQAVLFDITKWDATSARRWLDSHGIIPLKKVHKTQKYLRYRVNQPKKSKKMRTIEIAKGIKFIIMY